MFLMHPLGHIRICLGLYGIAVLTISGCVSPHPPASQPIAPFPDQSPYYHSHDIQLRRAYSQGYRTRQVATTMPRRELDWEREPHPGYSREEKEAWRHGANLADFTRLNQWISQNQGTYKK